jgi:hypothetical protein
MKKLLLIAIAASGLLFASASQSNAGVSVGIGVGVPVGYGYGYPYPYYAPYGPYYGAWRGPGWYGYRGHRAFFAHRWHGRGRWR